MSIEAVSWALNNEAVDNSTSKLVLIGLANHARPDGTAAFPSIATLQRYTRLSDRAIQKHLRLLEEQGIIRKCNPRIVEAHIQRADRRPIGYDLIIEARLEAPDLRDEPDSPRENIDKKQALEKRDEHDSPREQRGERHSPREIDRRDEPRSPREPNGVNGVPERGERGSPKPYTKPSNKTPPPQTPPPNSGSNHAASSVVVNSEKSDQDFENLAWPADLSALERQEARRLLIPAAASAQPILDVLATIMQAGQIRTSPLAVLAGLVKRWQAGTFDPAPGIHLAAARTRQAEIQSWIAAAVTRPPTRDPTSPSAATTISRSPPPGAFDEMRRALQPKPNP